MEERKINAKQLITDLGLAYGVVTEWKKGRAKPGTDAIVKIADYFNVTTDYLLGKTDNPHPPNKKTEPAPEAGSVEWLRQGLVARGIIKDGEDFSEELFVAALANIDTLVKLKNKLTNDK